MNLKHLKYLYWVSKLGSYTRAAEELDVTQPCVYRAVRSLERECGIQLVYLDKRRVRPTHAGRVLCDYGDRVGALESAAETSLAEILTPRKGAIFFGTTASFAYASAQGVADWHRSNPRQQIGFEVGPHQELYPRLLAGRLDFLFVPNSDLPKGLPSEGVICNDEVIFIAPTGHPLSKRRSIAPSELAREQFVSTFPGTLVHRLVEKIGAETGIRIKIPLQADRGDIIAEFVSAGSGIAAVSRSCAAEGIRQGKLVPLVVQGYPRLVPYGFVLGSGVALSQKGRSLLEHLSLCLSRGLDLPTMREEHQT